MNEYHDYEPLLDEDEFYSSVLSPCIYCNLTFTEGNHQMSDIVIRNTPAYLLDMTAEGDDVDVACSAWVSTKGQRIQDEIDYQKVQGLINFLMKNRHGSPFEQVGLRWMMKSTRDVWLEHQRHRLASYNQESGRYSKPSPEFYVIAAERPLVQEGKVGAYTFVPGTFEQYTLVASMQTEMAQMGWHFYEQQLDKGIAKEVARMVLPPTLYSSAYVRMNLRAVMNFLSLRAAETAMYEIQYLAHLVEVEFQKNFPMVYSAWIANGRMAP